MEDTEKVIMRKGGKRLSPVQQIIIDGELNIDDEVHQYLINFKSGARVTAWFAMLSITENSFEFTLPILKENAPPGLITPELIRLSEVEFVCKLRTMNAIEFYNRSDDV